jgi:hypothetical protein
LFRLLFFLVENNMMMQYIVINRIKTFDEEKN